MSSDFENVWLTSGTQLDEYEDLLDGTGLPINAYPLVEALSEKFSTNDSLVMGIYNNTLERRFLESCFVVYPLTQHAYEMLRSGVWKSGRILGKHDISPNWADASAIYIAGLVGHGTPARARIIAELMQFILSKPKLPVLARPASDNGRKLMERFDLKPIDHPNDVWLREGSTVFQAR